MSLCDLLKSWLGGRSKPPTAELPAAAAVDVLPDSPNEPAQVTSPKVLLIIYNPTMLAKVGKKLVAYMGWASPDDLVGQFITEVLTASRGLVRYQIVERLELDEFPLLADGFRYTPPTYLEVDGRRGAPHSPSGIDYQHILEQFDILKRVENREIDEVWVMAFPYAGLYKSVMAGAEAFWCNAPPLSNTDACRRRFAIMGFSYERGVGEMLHSYNHRCEAILAKVFDSLDFLSWTYQPNRTPATIAPDQALNPFQQFLLFDQIAPGKAAIGSVHYAPNGVRDYDLGNASAVKSECYDWLRFPDFRGDVRTVSSSEWGGRSESAYQRWWLDHLPKAAGRKNGVHNNWWQYVANPNNVIG